MNILQNISISKSEGKDTKKKKKKEPNAYRRLEGAKETREENAIGYPGLDLVVERILVEKLGKSEYNP